MTHLEQLMIRLQVLQVSRKDVFCDFAANLFISTVLPYLCMQRIYSENAIYSL